jgi:hypothetical protein
LKAVIGWEINMKNKQNNNPEANSEKSISASHEVQESVKDKSLFEIARGIQEKEQLEKEKQNREANEIRLEAERKERDDYAQKLHKEKIELMRLKQGVIQESEMIPQKEEKRVLTFKEKVSNFFYHNKLLLCVTVLGVSLVAYIIYDIVTKVNPDMTILLLSDNYELSNYSDKIEDVFEGMIQDENGDGKVVADVLYIPVSKGENSSKSSVYGSDNSAKLYIQLQASESFIIIADKDCENAVNLSQSMYNLEVDFPNEDNIDKYKFMLKDTNFSKMIGYDGKIDDDLYIGIKLLIKDGDFDKKKQKNFDISFAALKKFIDECNK